MAFFFQNLENTLQVATAHDVFRATDIPRPELYFPDEKVDSDNLPSIMKVVIFSAVGKVPGVGSLFSGLLKVLWPEKSKDDIWEEIRDKVDKLVQASISQNNAKQLRDRLQGLYLVLDYYAKQPKSVQHLRFPALMSVILHDAPAFINDECPALSLSYLVYFGTLYLSALWTQWRFCEKIDGCSDSKKLYESDVIEAVKKLRGKIYKAREDCIEERKRMIRQNSSWAEGRETCEVEDPKTHKKITNTQRDGAQHAAANALKHLQYDVEMTYGSEVDKIIAPARFWERFLPGSENETTIYQHVEFPGWVWDGVNGTKKWFDTKLDYYSYGNITRIVFYHTVYRYGIKGVTGIQLFYGNYSSGLFGQKSDSMCVIDIAQDEAIIGASARTEKGSLETLEFTKARIYKDSQGRSQVSNDQTTYTNGTSPPREWGGAFWEGEASRPNPIDHRYNGTNSSLHTMHMVWICGWAFTDPEAGSLGLIQPMFGCREIVEGDGKTTWA